MTCPSTRRNWFSLFNSEFFLHFCLKVPSNLVVSAKNGNKHSISNAKTIKKIQNVLYERMLNFCIRACQIVFVFVLIFYHAWNYYVFTHLKIQFIFQRFIIMESNEEFYFQDDPYFYPKLEIMEHDKKDKVSFKEFSFFHLFINSLFRFLIYWMICSFRKVKLICYIQN